MNSLLIVLCFSVFQIQSAHACHPSHCTTHEVCEPDMHHPRCHEETSCTPGTCGEIDTEASITQVVDETPVEAIENENHCHWECNRVTPGHYGACVTPVKVCD